MEARLRSCSLISFDAVHLGRSGSPRLPQQLRRPVSRDSQERAADEEPPGALGQRSQRQEMDRNPTQNALLKEFKTNENKNFALRTVVSCSSFTRTN